MDTLISIGQLSSIMGVSIRTIRYYEEIGILNPSKTTETNYRYYGADEKERLKLILFLKKMGFSLQEIKTVLFENEPASFLHMIRCHQLRLDQDLKETRLKQDILEMVTSTLRSQSSGQGNPIAAISKVSESKMEDIYDVFKDTPTIKVIGIGGHIVHVINNLVAAQTGIDIIHITNDEGTLRNSIASCKIQLSAGSGTDSVYNDVGLAVREEMTQINKRILGSELLFIIADMRDALCPSAISIIAQEARQQGLLTVGVIVRLPMDEEAEADVDMLLKHVDILLDIPIISRNHSDNPEDGRVGRFIEMAVTCFSSLILTAGIDLDDIKLLIKDKGRACIGIGQATGDNRLTDVIERVLDSPTLYKDINTARSVLIHITASNDLTLPDVDKILQALTTNLHPDANVVFGTIIDNELQESITITLITTE